MSGLVAGIRAEKAGPEHADSLAQLFERNACPCFCRYWHFEGDKNAWLDRCANRPDENRSDMQAALIAHADQMEGIIALSRTGVVGWMKLARAGALGKLYDQRLYRGLPCFSGDRSGVLAIGCFLIDSEQRRHGVARALLAEGIAMARREGARAIEAFPRRAEHVSDGELWTGPLALFQRAGFEEVHGFAPYPVLRLELTT